jgi:hypothetical protein
MGLFIWAVASGAEGAMRLTKEKNTRWAIGPFFVSRVRTE